MRSEIKNNEQYRAKDGLQPRMKRMKRMKSTEQTGENSHQNSQEDMVLTPQRTTRLS